MPRSWPQCRVCRKRAPCFAPQLAGTRTTRRYLAFGIEGLALELAGLTTVGGESVLDRDWAIGVDVGGSGCRFALVHSSGKLAGRRAVAGSGGLEFDRLLETIVREVNTLLSRDEARGGSVAGVGFVMPGFLSDDGRRVADAVNLPHLVGSDLPARLRDALPSPLVIDADCHAAGLAESRIGAGRNARRLIVVSIGSGIGATVLLDGRVLRFTRGGAGSLGHVVVAPDGPRCRCGARGCLEVMANGPAFEGDGVERAARWLAVGIATWSAVFRPDRVVLCGGVSQIGRPLLDAVRRSLRDIGGQSFAGGVEVALGAFGADAALVGAGLLALEAAEPAPLSSRPPADTMP